METAAFPPSFASIVKNGGAYLSPLFHPIVATTYAGNKEHFLITENDIIRRKMLQYHYNLPDYMEAAGFTDLPFYMIYGILRSYIIDIVYSPVVCGIFMYHRTTSSVETQNLLKASINVNLLYLVKQCIRHYRRPYPNTAAAVEDVSSHQPFSEHQVLILCKNIFKTIVPPADPRIDPAKYVVLTEFIKSTLKSFFFLAALKNYVSCYPF